MAKRKRICGVEKYRKQKARKKFWNDAMMIAGTIAVLPVVAVLFYTIGMVLAVN